MAYEFSSPSEQKNQKQKEKAEPIALKEEEEEEEEEEYDDDDEEEEEEEAKEEGEVVQWQWRGDNLQWCPYPPAVSSVIEDAFRSQKSCVNFRLGPSSYTVHFEVTGHRQRNLASGRYRSVKREISSDGTNISWVWFDSEKNNWHAYDANITNKIEEAWQESRATQTEKKEDAKAGFYCVIHKQAYVIEFESEAFQVNAKTKFSRSVRRSSYIKKGSNSRNSDSKLPQMVRDLDAQARKSPHVVMALSESSLHRDMATSSSSSSSKDDGLRYACGQEHIMDDESPCGEECCSICLSCLSDEKVARLSKCGHFFHRECIESWFKCRPSCPECLRIYGTITGTQPHGEMCICYIAHGSAEARYGLDGYPNTDIIKIIYKFPSGIQGSEHPNPGRPYTGTIRTAYLPKDKDGEEVCELLKKAWDRRLLFRIGTSVTTGQANVVTWATVHHKTQMHGGPSNHGYPDETYLSRVRKELEDLGVA